MKITDNYNAKYQFWAERTPVVPVPDAPKIPSFKSRHFASHAEMNEWKRTVLLALARQAAK